MRKRFRATGLRSFRSPQPQASIRTGRGVKFCGRLFFLFPHLNIRPFLIMTVKYIHELSATMDESTWKCRYTEQAVASSPLSAFGRPILVFSWAQAVWSRPEGGTILSAASAFLTLVAFPPCLRPTVVQPCCRAEGGTLSSLPLLGCLSASFRPFYFASGLNRRWLIGICMP